MIHSVKIGNATHLVELPEPLTDGQEQTARLDGRVVKVRWLRRHGVLQVIEDGVERNLFLRSRAVHSFDGEPTAAATVELVSGAARGAASVEAQVTPHVPGQDVRKGAQASKGLVLRSQITGKVLKVLVKAGDAVQAGQVAFVVEAMKMENRIAVAAAGTVQAVGVKEGEQVAAGKELLRLAP